MTARSAVIFDLDGTLTRPNLDFDLIRAELGVEGPILEALEHMNAAERGRAETVLCHHEQQAAENAILYEGAVDVIEACRAGGRRVAVLTRNSRRSLDLVLSTHGIVMDAVRTREDGAIKPSAEPVLSLCRELEVDPHRSWMIGDYLFDILSGRSAGTRTVLMIGEKAAPAFADQADFVIRALPELLPILAIPGPP